MPRNSSALVSPKRKKNIQKNIILAEVLSTGTATCVLFTNDITTVGPGATVVGTRVIGTVSLRWSGSAPTAQLEVVNHVWIVAVSPDASTGATLSLTNATAICNENSWVMAYGAGSCEMSQNTASSVIASWTPRHYDSTFNNTVKLGYSSRILFQLLGDTLVTLRHFANMAVQFYIVS